MQDKRLSDCSDAEVKILASIIALAQQLPHPMAFYTRALGTIREKYFLGKSHTRPRKTAGYIDGHQIRATESW